MHSSHGFFLTCTQKSCLHLHSVQLINIYTTYRQSSIEPLAEIKRTLTYLEGQYLAHGSELPSPLAPCLGATAPPFDSYPFHPFPTSSAHITLFTMTTSTITAFLMRDTYAFPEKKGTFLVQRLPLLLISWNRHRKAASDFSLDLGDLPHCDSGSLPQILAST